MDLNKIAGRFQYLRACLPNDTVVVKCADFDANKDKKEIIFEKSISMYTNRGRIIKIKYQEIRNS
ncbi:hypothetical protein BpHYR1_021707 [Brachionus plicatilis]|uniref:Uncharacterized protein n=1 Tax=Brachionus plicatilis TaxID=10195 RepID=A0A3M7T5Z3_BRAPC|nr:hypothetical protein BpHYR1_021707 [Brachionus plicatilis]